MRRHLTYANIAATLALVFAMTGGAVAAKHYLVNSTGQINPKVLKKLHGQAGPQGKQGPEGKAGPAGMEGAPGQTGLPGPVSVTRIDSFEPFEEAPNESDEFKLMEGAVTEHFNNVRTTAQVTVSVDLASANGKPMETQLGICFMPVGGTRATEVSAVAPEFEAPAMSFFAQTVEGMVTDLAPGDYLVGACTADESANVAHGDSAGTIELTETTEGGSRFESAVSASALERSARGRAVAQRHAH